MTARLIPSFNVLAIDGGGIRGVFTARVLERLAQERPEFVSRVALCAGTSTGGILALGLANGLSPASLVRLYRDQAKAIFPKRWFGGLWRAKHANDGLRTALEAAFGSVTIGELQKYVLIASYDLDAPEKKGRPRTGKAKFFESVDDADESVVRVAMASAAAPTYFASVDGFVDGGVIATNPAMSAAAQAIAWGHPREDLRVLSLGTGIARDWINGQANDWGLAQWAPKLAGLLIDGVGGVSDYQCAQVFGDQYHRIDVALPAPVELNDVNAIDGLIALADGLDLSAALAWLDASGWFE